MSTQYTVFWCFFHALCMYCARRGACKSILSGSLWFLSMGPQAERILSVCCSNFDFPVSFPNWCWNANWLHIRHDKCIGRNRQEQWHCPVKWDQWDCVLKDLEEFGGTRLFLLNQYNTGIFSCFLLLLPCFSSIFRQTNDDNTRSVSEDCLCFSRIQSLHRLLGVDFHDEEDESISLTLYNRRLNILLVQHRSEFFLPNRYSSCGWACRISSLCFCFGLWSACKITCIQF